MIDGGSRASARAESRRLLAGLAARVGVNPRPRREPVDADDDFAERAAIMEFDGGLTRADAEQFARAYAALGPTPAPEAVAALDAQLLVLDMQRALAATTRARQA